MCKLLKNWSVQLYFFRKALCRHLYWDFVVFFCCSCRIRKNMHFRKALCRHLYWDFVVFFCCSCRIRKKMHFRKALCRHLYWDFVVFFCCFCRIRKNMHDTKAHQAASFWYWYKFQITTLCFFWTSCSALEELKVLTWCEIDGQSRICSLFEFTWKTGTRRYVQTIDNSINWTWSKHPSRD